MSMNAEDDEQATMEAAEAKMRMTATQMVKTLSKFIEEIKG